MIISTRHGNVALQSREANLGALIQATGGTLRSGGGLSVSKSDVAGLPAFQQGIRIAAQSIAKHEMGVWRGKDVDRRRVSATWQAKLFDGQPNEREPWFLVWEQTEASLTARNNAFWLKVQAGGRVEEVHVLHPDLVEARWNPVERRAEYKLTLDTGQASVWLTAADVLHFRVGAPAPGQVVTPSPLELHRRTWASAIARSRAEENHYSNGVMQSIAVVFPDKVTPDQADRWKQVYMGPGGVDNDSQVKVFGGDPRIETIGLSLQDSQYVEAEGFSIYDVGRILGVPPSLLWAATASGDKPITPEHEEDRWWRYGLQPRRMRIEATIEHDPSFFGGGARDYPMFRMDQVATDAKTESDILVHEVQSGIRLVDEARAVRGLAPLPDGAGMIPQITPVGGAPNTAPAVVPQEYTRAGEIVVLRETVRETRQDREPLVVNNHVAVPEQPAPVVNVEARAAEQPAAIVNVTVDPTPVTVAAPSVQIDNHIDTPARKVTIRRNGQGWINEMDVEDA